MIHCLNLIVPAVYCNSKYPAPYLTWSVCCSPYFLLVHTEWVPCVGTHFSTQYRNSKWEIYQCSFLIQEFLMLQSLQPLFFKLCLSYLGIVEQHVSKWAQEMKLRAHFGKLHCSRTLGQRLLWPQNGTEEVEGTGFAEDKWGEVGTS